MTAPAPDLAVGLIADIVGSRQLGDRREAQQEIHRAFEAAHEVIPPVHPAWATVGDEFQAVYASWQDALRASTRLMAELPAGVRIRCGLGRGELREIESGAQGPIQDGDAWLRAREAIEESASRGRRREEVASWFRSESPELDLAVDAHLLLRDHIIARLKSRERRICALLLAGRRQAEVAAEEHISQSAVSQAHHRSGVAALLEADELLAGGERE